MNHWKVINKDMNVVLQPTKKLNICGKMLAYETHKVLLIVKKEDVVSKIGKSDELQRAKNTQDLVTKLMMANVNQMSEVEKLRFMDSQLCATLGTVLNLASRLNNEYFEIVNSQGKKAILFAKHGLILVLVKF